MKKVVVKIGSSILAPQGKIDTKFVRDFIKDVIAVEKDGRKVIIVSSGAIACGLSKLHYKKKPQDLNSLMALASLGQIVLMEIYTEHFKHYRKMCAQVLLTWDDFNNRIRYLNAKGTINKLLELNITPIINENDTVASDEIKFGDNDRLSALVSDLVGAEMLIILSDIEGLLAPSGLIKEVENIDRRIIRLAKREDKVFTSGGMVTKLEAAKIATLSGIKTVIANGKVDSVVSRIIKGEHLGTVFIPKKDIEKARKRWIAFGRKKKGKIFIDEGAKDALISHKKSLLAVGITEVEGSFLKGDTVEVVDREGNIVGCGIVSYPSEELKKLKGKKLLREVIHRDNFVKEEDNDKIRR